LIQENLPVVIVNLVADFNSDFVTISWSTEFESDVLGWNIYRSNNGYIEDIIQLTGGGLIPGCNCPSDYEFIDFEIELNQTYWYWIECIFMDGTANLYGFVSDYTGNVSVNEVIIEDSIIDLYQNYPNPFNPTTMIYYDLKSSGFIDLKVYNTKGQFVETLVNREMSVGIHSVVWNTAGISSGQYFYQISVDGEAVQIKKATCIK